MTSRRDFLRHAAVASTASVVLPSAMAAATPSREVLELAAAQFAVTDAATNLEAGFWGMMPAPVLAA